jgi:hypothetical protein
MPPSAAAASSSVRLVVASPPHPNSRTASGTNHLLIPSGQSKKCASKIAPAYFSEELNAHLHDLTTRVIREAIDDDVREPAEQASTKALPEASGG